MTCKVRERSIERYGLTVLQLNCSTALSSLLVQFLMTALHTNTVRYSTLSLLASLQFLMATFTFYITVLAIE